jgi:hypothetical protein
MFCNQYCCRSSLQFRLRVSPTIHGSSIQMPCLGVSLEAIGTWWQRSFAATTNFLKVSGAQFCVRASAVYYFRHLPGATDANVPGRRGCFGRQALS